MKFETIERATFVIIWLLIGTLTGFLGLMTWLVFNIIQKVMGEA
jgi:hypothetical protein